MGRHDAGRAVCRAEGGHRHCRWAARGRATNFFNLALASERLQQKVAELIARVAGTPLRDWAHSWGRAEPGEAAATRSLEKAPSSPRRLREAVELAAPEEPPWRSVGVAGMLLGAAMSGLAMALREAAAHLMS